MSETATLLFNPLDPAFRVNPYPAYARLRAEAPVYRAANGTWVLSRYDDCVAVLRGPAWSSDARNSSAYRRAVEQGRADFSDDMLGETPPFLVLDPPDHTRLRRLVSKAFTPKVVGRLRPFVQRVVEELLAAVAERGVMDVVEDFAYPLPLAVICELLGVPLADHASLREWSRRLSRGMDPPEVLPPEVVAARRDAGNEFAAYFRALIQRRRATPGDDLLSALISAEDGGVKLSEEELISTCIFLLAAGHETTVNLISGGMLALLEHPDQHALLAADPSLAASAVEEFLRYDAPVQYAYRTALEDVEIAGTTIPAGAQAVALLGSANRDEAQFEEPDRLDIRRADNHHIGFGFGIHFCLGAPLARLEGQVAFQRLLPRLRDLQLAGEPRYKEHIVLRGLRSLPISFAPLTKGSQT